VSEGTGIEVRIQLPLLERLAALGKQELATAVETAVRLSVDEIVTNVQANKLTLGAPRYLNVRTGMGRRSIVGRTMPLTGGKVVGMFGSHLDYMRAHELGFQGRVQVRGHSRRVGKGSATVRPHERMMNMRARRFLRDALQEGIPNLDARLGRALSILMVTGKPPTTAQLGG